MTLVAIKLFLEHHLIVECLLSLQSAQIMSSLPGILSTRMITGMTGEIL